MTDLIPGKKYRARYDTSVFKAKINGWRQESVDVIVEAISAKRVKVIDCEGGKYYGSKRQYYNPDGIARREIGKIKLASSLYSVEEIEEAEE